jgi:hypothetical protein
MLFQLLRKSWPVALLFGGVSIILLISILEQNSFVKIPVDKLLDNIPIDSGLVRDIRQLSPDRKGVPFSALKLNGSGEYFPFSTPAGNLTDDFSFSFWAHISETGKEQTLFQKGENCPDGDADYKGMSYEVILLADGRLAMKLFAPPGNYNDEFIQFNSNNPVPIHQWILIVITFDHSSGFECFLNAEPVEIKSINKMAPSRFLGIHQTKSVLKIGANENYCGYVHSFRNFFHGEIDDVSIFKGKLQFKQIQALYIPQTNQLMKYRISILVIVLAFMSVVLFQFSRNLIFNK